MEIELKAPIDWKIVEKIWNNPVGRDFVIKQDRYFSLQGKVEDKPKNVYRIRNNYVIQPSQPSIDWLKKSFFTENDLTELAEKFTKENVVTYKIKSFQGTEVNEEFETSVQDDSVLLKIFESLDYKVYFTKEKRSVIFNINDLCVEIVKVNNSDLYLEAEAFTDNEKDVSKVQQKLKDFFEEYGITEFDNRSWREITHDIGTF